MTEGKYDAIHPVLIEELHKFHFFCKRCFPLIHTSYDIIQSNKSILIENDSAMDSLQSVSILLICTIFAD